MKHFDNLEQLRHLFDHLNVEKLIRVFPQTLANIDLLGEIQGHQYKHKKIAAAALIHRSALVFWPQDKTGIFSNERLEFLGDAFLNFFVASSSMFFEPLFHEGELSRLRAAIVGTENLALKSRELGIGNCLLVGKAEVNSSLNQFDNILADAFEAVTAALAIDAGEEKAKQWLSQVFQKDFQMGPETLIRFDTKGKVQQWIQSVLNQPPVYKTIGTVGTPQETQFIVAAFVGDYEIARATAKSKREASKKVAIKILDMIESNELTKEKMMNYFGKEK